jgi:hypothetical protein
MTLCVTCIPHSQAVISRLQLKDWLKLILIISRWTRHLLLPLMRVKRRLRKPKRIIIIMMLAKLLRMTRAW